MGDPCSGGSHVFALSAAWFLEGCETPDLDKGTGILSDRRRQGWGSRCLISLGAGGGNDFPKVAQGICGKAETGGLIRPYKIPGKLDKSVELIQACKAFPQQAAPWASKVSLVSLCQGTPWVVCKIWEAGVRAGGSFCRSLVTGPQHMREHTGECEAGALS